MSRGKGILHLLAWAGVGFAAAAGWRALERRRPQPRRALPPAPPDPKADVSVAWVPSPGGSVRVASCGERGSEPAFLFVHGLGGDHGHWRGVMDALVGIAGPAVRAGAVDLPGHGDSEPSPGDQVSVADLSAALAAAADGLGMRHFVLAGHSLGATAALHYAAHHPRRVAGLLLVDPAGDQSHLSERDRETCRQALADDAHGELERQYRHFLEPSDAEVRARVLASLEVTPARVLHGAFAAGLRHSSVEDLDAYRKTGGTACVLATPWNDAPYSLHRLRPDLPLHVLRGGGHWIMLDAPDLVAARLVDLAQGAGGGVH